MLASAPPAQGETAAALRSPLGSCAPSWLAVSIRAALQELAGAVQIAKNPPEGLRDAPEWVGLQYLVARAEAALASADETAAAVAGRLCPGRLPIDFAAPPADDPRLFVGAGAP
jgi:hypothetical protein